MGVALLVGAAMIKAMDLAIPHEHFIKGPEGRSSHRLKRTWLFVFAICLHNLPEGLAIGVGFANSHAQGVALATGIALQDLPEGFVVAVALIVAGYGRLRAMLVGMASGLVEPVGAVKRGGASASNCLRRSHDRSARRSVSTRARRRARIPSASTVRAPSTDSVVVGPRSVTS